MNLTKSKAIAALLSGIAGMVLATAIPFWATLVLATILVVLAVMLALTRREKSALESVDSLISDLDAMPNGANRNEALRAAHALRKEIDNTSHATSLALTLGQLTATMEAAPIHERAKAIIKNVQENDDHKIAPPLLSFRSLLIGVPIVWLLCFTLVVLGMWFFTSGEQPLADRLFEKSKHGNGTAGGQFPIKMSLGDFLGLTGSLGDTFGFASSLLSALAVAGAIYSILLQGKELALQRDEMSMTRRELSRTADAQSRSDQALAAQARISALHFLAEHQRSIRNADPSVVKRHEAAGREQAHAYELEQTLHQIGRDVAAREVALDRRQLATELSLKVLLLEQQYNELPDVADINLPIDPVDDILLRMIETITKYTTLVPFPFFASMCFKHAHQFAASVVNKVNDDLELDPGEVRAMMIERSNICFALLNRAVQALQHPEQFDVGIGAGMQPVDFLLNYEPQDPNQEQNER